MNFTEVAGARKNGGTMDYHNTDETTYDLISRLRKEAKQGAPSQSGNAPHPSAHSITKNPAISRKGSTPIQNPRGTPHVNFHNKSKGQKQILGMKLSTVLMGISTLFALGILAVGLTILFANQTIGSPRNGASYPSTQYPAYGDYGSGADDNYLDNDYNNNENYYEDYDDHIEYSPEYQDADDTQPEPFTPQDVAEAIEPRLEELIYQLDIYLNPDEWADILADFATDAYNAYATIDLLGEDWRILVSAHAESEFLASEWAAALNNPPEE